MSKSPRNSPPGSPPPLRAVVSSQNGEITCSVEETNRIRLALGLKPLRTSKPSSDDVHSAPRNSDAVGPQSLRARVEAARRARRVRSRAVAQRSIAEEAFLNDTDEDEDPEQRSGDAELEAWVARSRFQEAKSKQKVTVTTKRGATQASVQADDDTPAVPESVIEETQLGAAPSVLVLADTSVLKDEDKKAGEAVDELESDSRRTKKRPRSPEINGAMYDGTDNAEFGADHSQKPGGVSIAMEDIKPAREDQEVSLDKAFRKRSKRDRGSRLRRKRRRGKESDDSGEEKPIDTSHLEKVRGRMQELRRVADARQAADDADDSDEDPLYKSLIAARKKAMDSQVKSSVDTILDAISRANEVDQNSEQKDQVMANAERIVYDEMEQFLQRIPTTADDSSSDSDSSGEAIGAGAGGKEPLKEEGFMEEPEMKRVRFAVETKNPEQNGSEPEEAKEVKQNVADGIPSQSVESNGSTGESVQSGPNLIGLPTEDSLNHMGVSGVLNRLRARGELRHRTEQIGRALDKRFDIDDRTEDNGGTGKREIKLEYLDEFGNQLTRKEAFRVLCHKFHGKGPGQNKREKRLRKMLESLKTRNMQSGDTPLASAAALKEETRKLGTAHVVLSGSQAVADVNTIGQQSSEAEQGIPRDKPTHNESQAEKDQTEGSLEAEEKVTFTLGMAITGGSKRRRR